MEEVDANFMMGSIIDKLFTKLDFDDMLLVFSERCGSSFTFGSDFDVVSDLSLVQ